MSNSAEYNRIYKNERVGQINISGSKEWLEQVKVYATARGMKTNTFIKNLIIEEMQRRPLDQYTSDMPLNATKTPVESFADDYGISVKGEDKDENRGITDVNRMGQNGAVDQSNGQVIASNGQAKPSTAQTEQAIKDIKTEIINGIIAALQGMKA